MTQAPSADPLDPTQAFAELGRISLGQESIESVLQKVADLARRVVPGVAEASVTVLRERAATTAVATGPLARELDEAQYRHGHGPCMQAAGTGELVEVVDARTETRWPGYTDVAAQRGALSSLSVPVPIRAGGRAALNLYGTGPAAFGPESRELASSFAAYATVAVTNVHLYEETRALAGQLQTALEHRAVIDQAKGIVMSQRRCTAEEAFALLVAASQRTNRKVRDIAQALVEGTGNARTPPPTLEA